MIEAAVDLNNRHPDRLLVLLEHHVDFEGARITVLGLAFTSQIDDTWNSRAIPPPRGPAGCGR
ncbi:hypothetical protein [Natronosalvus rutilus]|uniref:Uncharacterized protein n=1 Tax=Natronosalvus rutilus TaxID=2953753 RepID=A0A9E7SWA3_9EURY|nr:hypothetical protein [Natronosalvus rutilus]UTF54822.1 hypothetical protein NGM29_06035 [Natronosalvus rutilus]